MLGREIHKKYDIKKIWNSFCFLFNIKAKGDIINLFNFPLPKVTYCPVFTYYTLDLYVSVIFQNIKRMTFQPDLHFLLTVGNLTSVNRKLAYNGYWKILKDIFVFHCYSVKMMTPKCPSRV